MNIAIIGHKSIPGISGGVEKHVEEISARLAEMGFNVTCYNRSGYEKINKRAEWRGVKLKYVRTLHFKGLEAFVYSLFASLRCMVGKYDVVHYHALGSSVMSFLPKLTGKKVIVTVHGLDWQRVKWGRFGRIYLKVGEFASSVFSDMIISVSDSLLKYYCIKYPEVWKKICYIPNGVTPVIYRRADIINKKYGLECGGYILFLARIVPEKGCHYLLQAFNEILKTRRINIKLVIAGGGEYDYKDNYVKSLKEIANNKNIIFTGDVKGEMIEELYSNALFYVLPSEVEGMPISLLEAMSAGLCPLVSNIRENMEIIGEECEAGFCFESRDIESLKMMLIHMMENRDEVKRRGEKAREFVAGCYTWHKVAEGLRALLSFL